MTSAFRRQRQENGSSKVIFYHHVFEGSQGNIRNCLKQMRIKRLGKEMGEWGKGGSPKNPGKNGLKTKSIALQKRKLS